MSFEFTGKIVRIGETEQVSDKFKKRSFVVTDGRDQYPQNIQFELHQDKTDIIDVFKVGDEAKVKFNLRGRDWTDKEGAVKTFNTLQCWALLKLEGEKFKGETLTPSEDDGLGF